MESRFISRPNFIVGLTIIVAVLAVYLQVLNHGFVSYDDQAYILDNQRIRTGLNWNDVRWFFYNPSFGNWHPLTSVSFMLDVHLFDLLPGGLHFTNMLLHMANSLLCWIFLQYATGRRWESALVALLFAIHPLHVESVAWISERKDVLSGFFWFLTMIAYTAYCQRPGAGRYVLAFFLFCLGLLSKPMVVTLPFVLLLLDYWPLNRLRFASGGQRSTRRYPLWFLIAEKIPLLVCSAAAAIITYFVQAQYGAVDVAEQFPLPYRLLNAMVSYGAYLQKTFLPLHLSAFYPPVSRFSALQIFCSAAVLLLTTGFVIRYRNRHPYMLVGWLWYVGTLVPVIGIVRVGLQSMADRYTYLPLVGIFILLTWWLSDMVSNRAVPGKAVRVLSVVIIFLLAFLSYRQAATWRNSTTLYTHMLASTSGNFLAHNGLGIEYIKSGDLDAAHLQLKQSLRIRPTYADTHYHLGHLLFVMGNQEQAVQYFKNAMRLKPTYAAAYNYLGYVYMQQGNYPEAAVSFEKAVEIDPLFSLAYCNWGDVLLLEKKTALAQKKYTRAREIDPGLFQARQKRDQRME